ncbi:hypothetical protein N7481_013225 [Penicillium waksmanii]|uniref:uncharacterized protein n=1 Tax=Penicillium waksmanii TaxID=69791 RepID=UPI0025496189|nr:uncharacterized protein N7481_013225 [Penicillium waksmanii]KAJ5966511.1 hypothetical protein N7481_013225 [Penicillium waksmanii]
MPGRRQESAPTGSFGVTAARSGSPIHFLPLTAAGSHFYLGGKSQTYIPEGVPLSKSTNDTILTGSHYLDVVVPGGQEIYVDASGALTPPARAAVSAPGATAPASLLALLLPMPLPPPTAAAWQVFSAQKNATVPTGNINDCLGFDALAVPINTNTTQPTWEYI